ncbi:hypothetical protein CUMW_173450 [Citrus unshiu]|nr:hypothetical protein CUMW_173450 [Citrus unshiu]
MYICVSACLERLMFCAAEQIKLLSKDMPLKMSGGDGDTQWGKEEPQLRVDGRINGRRNHRCFRRNHQVLIHDCSEPTSDERPDPVDPILRPSPSHQGGPEGPGGIHGCSVEWPADEDVRPGEKPHGQWCYGG